jgi:DMSO/TMAO reductase YedYZ molybdopterin-dependent catalytic subunit
MKTGGGLGPHLLGGFILAVLLSLFGFAVTLVMGFAYPPIVLYDRITQFLGTPTMFQLVHSLLGYGQAGKIAAFLSVIVAWLGSLTLLRLLGVFFNPVFGAAPLFFVLAWLVSLPVAVIYAVGFLALSFALQPLEYKPERRAALRTLAGGAALLLVGGAIPLFRTAISSAAEAKRNAWTRFGNLPLGVTTQQDLYYVSKNIEAFDPNLETSTWKLEVTGLVNRPSSYTLEQLQAFPAITSERTLYCISNPVGGGLVGNIIWTGLDIRKLLREVAVKPEATWVTWHAADGYKESLPLEQIMEQEVLLAYAANGESLQRKHGFPLRVLIPDRLGMKQLKWLTRIELTNKEQLGYWAEREWTKTGFLEISSRIDEPTRGTALIANEPILIRGMAFAGTKPIVRVEISTDNGKTWKTAKLESRRTQYTWTLWSIPWTPTVGAHQLVVRAYTDEKMQTATRRESLPEAATGWHKLEVVAA